jgi:hypothetical protein
MPALYVKYLNNLHGNVLYAFFGNKLSLSMSMSIFPSAPSVKVEQLLHGLGLSRKNKDKGGKNIKYFPQLDYCTHFGVTIKNTWA